MSGRHGDWLSTDLKIITRDIGSLLLMEAGLMTVTTIIALGFREFHAALGCLLAGGVTAAVGGLANRGFVDAPPPKMKHGMVIAAGGWLAVATFGALPFLLTAWVTPPAVMDTFVPLGTDTSAWEPIGVGGTTTLSSLAYFRNPLHAFFESMSGWTGSGLTMAIHEPSLPRAIQWWRSFIQWVGGVGVIVLTVSILARPGSGSYALYRSEAREEKIHPSIVSTVRTVWKLVVGYTLLAFVLLFGAILGSESEYAESLPLWEVAWQALNHAMTALTTGGFSVTDNSIATYNSPLVEAVLLPIMILGAIAFPVHYVVLRDRKVRELAADLQTRWLLVLLGLGVASLSLQNVLSVPSTSGAFATRSFLSFSVPALDGAQLDAIRDSTFQWISALTCTGFQSAPIGRWLAGAKVLVVGAMVLGGAAGSTVGGIKIIRGYTIARGIIWQFSRVFLPTNAVVTARIGDRTLDREVMEREFSEAAIVTLLWLIVLVTSSVVLVNVVGPDFGYADALFEVASAQGNVGLSTGITGPGMSPIAEGMFVLNMWVGRLEIIPVLVFVRAGLYGLDP
ncbi:potassium transporter TrkG [Haloplanus aerogenes]|uniref:Potassium transporter Trk n=1 Tax=Haloplanus aerogenes TaxID=660522 RepID=A0A3M0CRJ5_9EURY|nr:potassium transporter TrkG [Haloplanus aerogenes]AZH25934.1 potassium transporter Trk [Haloplanus aerogenes]RMB11627.1 trk system potassium uptake protein TrkH [Haloplanus aerogenes]